MPERVPSVVYQVRKTHAFDMSVYYAVLNKDSNKAIERPSLAS